MRIQHAARVRTILVSAIVCTQCVSQRIRRFNVVRSPGNMTVLVVNDRTGGHTRVLAEDPVVEAHPSATVWLIGFAPEKRPDLLPVIVRIPPSHSGTSLSLRATIRKSVLASQVRQIKSDRAAHSDLTALVSQLRATVSNDSNGESTAWRGALVRLSAIADEHEHPALKQSLVLIERCLNWRVESIARSSVGGPIACDYVLGVYARILAVE